MSHNVAFVSGVGEVFDTVTEAFGTPASNSWGSGWSLSGGTADDYDIAAGVGTHTLTSVAVARRAYRTSLSYLDVDVRVKIIVPAVATDAALVGGILCRYVGSGDHIRFDARFGTDSNVTMQLVAVGGSGVTMATSAAVGAYTAGSEWWVRARTVGRICYGKIWAASGSEPDTWTATGLNMSTTTGYTAGSVGLRSIAETSNSNGTVAFSFDDFSIASTITTRLDLSDGTTWTLLDSGTEFPPPPLQRATAGTLLADGVRIPAAAYGNRVLKLRLNLTAASEDASATAMQQLFRELDRPDNVLRWAPAGATEPVYFRTFRTSADAVREVVPSGGLREFQVDVPAEPFAVGLRQTVAAATVTNDIAAGSGGCYYDIDAASVLGDVETPAVLSIVYSGIEDKGPTAVGVRRRGTPSLAPLGVQCEAMTGGTNTTIQANDALMSGSGQNFMRCTFGTASLTTRLTSATFPSTPGVDVRGIYRAFLRYRKSVAGDTIAVQLGVATGATTVTNRAVTLASTTNIRWADLGTVQLPVGADPRYDGLSGAELPAQGTVFTIAASRSGSGNLDFDCLALVPADDRLCLVTWPTSSGPTIAVIDSTTETVYNLGLDGSVYPEETSQVAGLFPYLSPNQDQRLTVLLNAAGDAATATDSIASTITVTTSYWPRYLYVRPATT